MPSILNVSDKVRVLCLIQQLGSYWDETLTMALVEAKPRGESLISNVRGGVSLSVHGFVLWSTRKLTNQTIASLSRQESQPAGTTKWPTTLRFGENLRNNFSCEKYTLSTKCCQM